MNDYLEWLKGKKSYILTVATILYAITGYAIQLHDQEAMMILILGALGISSVRHGVKTEADRQIEETEQKMERTVYSASRPHLEKQDKTDTEGRSY